ncbi:VCBS repeat-containing protein [Solirubrobacter ginsenosidimutans]|uniref:VCBS repeat-containing protein n=1 Tax=Solirubrobacter ginsenosidimutans TaxID=490573 RepID=A0A9X3RZH8_9ACTN|nr:VCBS repeat-containing protein [Solirubrobacter ginsenosidimutans]
MLAAAASGHASAAYAGGVVSTPISGLTGPTDLASADFDGNGLDDLAISEGAGSALVVQLNQGAGGFTSRRIPQSGHPDEVATGDLDHDGRPDVVTLAKAERSVDLNLRDTAGDWQTLTLANVGTDPAGIAVGDLNGDGWGDVAVTDAGADANDDYALRLFLRDPLSADYDETTLTNFHDAGKGGPLAVAIGDLDGDGRADLATANDDNAVTVMRFIQQPDGTFTRRPLSSFPRQGAAAIAIGDLGGNGPGADVAVGGSKNAWVNRRPGATSDDRYFSGPEEGFDAIAILRVSGIPALAASSTHPGRNVTVWSGYNLQTPETFGTAAAARALTSGDFDGDGLADLATLQPADGKVLLVTRLSWPIEYPLCGTAVASIARRVRCSWVVPTLYLLLDQGPLSFGTFTPGLTSDYTATANAHVISTLESASLTVSEPGKLTNGSATLDSPLAVSFSKAAWTKPVADDPVTITFKQHIDEREILRTGAYSRTVTFTLAATEP